MCYTINIQGNLTELREPQVMGIVNVTPDSFYADSRQSTAEGLAARVRQIVNEGGTMIDVGACSTRPGGEPASQEEEMERLRWALPVVRREAPDAVVSVDTFRPDVARMVVEELGADLINDVGGPARGATAHAQKSRESSRAYNVEMFRMVSRLRVPYIYMSAGSTIEEVLLDCAGAVQLLRDYGQKDIVLDPGFGFGKTLEQNYEVLRQMDRLKVLELPLLVGVSRKSMIYRLLGTTPEEALNGTTVLNTIALQKGAAVLRVHDVAAAVECVKLITS